MKPPAWIARLLGPTLAVDGRALAVMAAASIVLIAVLGGLASYVDNYYTESVGQWVANDLRMRVYDHLESLSFTYYDTHQTGVLLSTIIDDVSTVQDFVSSSTLSILIDFMTIVGMLGLMFWLSWDFALLVVAVTPFLLLFVARFRRAIKKATREVRRRESDIMAVLQTGLESMRTVQSVGAQDIEEARLGEASQATVRAALSARRVKSLLSPAVAFIVSLVRSARARRDLCRLVPDQAGAARESTCTTADATHRGGLGMTRSLIVLPDDSAKPILAAIEGASRTLRVKMFVFSDASLLKAVIAAKRRGVTVRVMLNPARRSGEQDNETTRTALEGADIDVKDANPAFVLTHEKSMVIDEKTAFVKSLNWATRNLTETRDYAVVTTRGHDVAEIIECFEADWHRHAFGPRDKSHLVWCPGPERDRICQFIDDARHRLFVQNERFQDMVIIERLIRAKRRGVKVDVMARPPHTLKREKLVEGVGGLRIMDDTGIKIHKLKHLKLHGKMLLADGVAAIIGSINFAAGSLDGRRELVIEVRDDDVVDRLHKVARHDWKHSHPLDLSDEGLLSDLEGRIEDSGQLLAIDGQGEHSGD